MRDDLAVPRGTDAVLRTRDLSAAHDLFVSTGVAAPSMRSVVLDSWRRSLACGLDPERARPEIRLIDDGLRRARAAHPLTEVMPVIRRLLVESASDAGLLVAVSDAAGQLLYVEGASALRAAAEQICFVEGADWSEASAGTNAPGTALTLRRPVQLLGPEHLSRHVTPWSCTAAPIRDPDTGALLGVLDVTGGVEVATPYALSLVRATVAAAEAELRIARLEGRSHSGGTSSVRTVPRLAVLGRSSGLLTQGLRSTELALRASEVLIVLASTGAGLNAAELGVALSEAEQAPVTVRAEVSRMRSAIAPLLLASRPYRLVGPVRTDVAAVRSALRTGQLRRAVAAYPGKLLPRSVAPAVVTLREDLHDELRAGVLASEDPDAILAFADTLDGRDDHAVWARALAVLPSSSPRRPQVATHLARLDDELR